MASEHKSPKPDEPAEVSSASKVTDSYAIKAVENATLAVEKLWKEKQGLAEQKDKVLQSKTELMQKTFARLKDILKMQQQLQEWQDAAIQKYKV